MNTARIVVLTIAPGADGIAAYLASVWPHLRTVEQKREVVVNQARPFTFSDDEISALIEQIDSGLEKGAEDA